MIRNPCIAFFLTAIIITLESLAAQTLTDVDGNTYKTVTIGGQDWMAENLRVKSFRNGDPIPGIADDLVWKLTESPARCYYDNDPVNGQTYGLLYNGYAVGDTRGLCPEGWHVPSAKEWEKMFEVFGGIEKAGITLKPMDVFSSWSGNNQSGFTALPGGCRLDSGAFFFESLKAYWWASDGKTLFYLTYFDDTLSNHSAISNTGASVRCVRDR